jgi:hypothetical protein
VTGQCQQKNGGHARGVYIDRLRSGKPEKGLKTIIFQDYSPCFASEETRSSPASPGGRTGGRGGGAFGLCFSELRGSKFPEGRTMALTERRIVKIKQPGVEIATRTDIEIGLDTATRYVQQQATYDAGPGFVRNAKITLH